MSEASDYSDNEGEFDSDYESTPKTPIMIKPNKILNQPKFESYGDDSEPEEGEEEEEEEDEVNEDENKANDDAYSSAEEDVDDTMEDEEEDDDDGDSDIEIDEEGMVKEKAKQPSKKLPVAKGLSNIVVDDEDEDDDEYDENYLQKFDSELNKNYIKEFHPECLNKNYDEVEKLSIIVRDKNGIIIDKLHKTIPFLTKYEKARILGQRAKQIETGSKPFINVPENIIDSYIIAELELREKKIPFIIKRPIPGGTFEYWDVRDLEVISF